MPTDDERIQGVLAGVEADAEALVARHLTEVRLYAAKVAPRPDLADDIAQKAFLVALRNLDRYDATRSFALWMHGIVRNLAREEWKRIAQRSRVERDDLADYIERIAEADDTRPEVDDRWIESLRGCIAALPERARDIVRLRYDLGIGCGEVATRIGTRASAVKMALVRIRRLLRDCVLTRLAGNP